LAGKYVLVKHFTDLDQGLIIDSQYDVFYKRALSQKLPTEKERLDLIIQQGLWTDKDQYEISRQRSYIDILSQTKITKKHLLYTTINALKSESILHNGLVIGIITYNIDMIRSYYNKKLIYFDAEYIVTQPWAPHSSSESRMIVSDRSIDKPFIDWDSAKYENQFYFLKNIRLFKFYQNFVFNLIENDINKELHYDGCYDCSREIMILADCIDKHSNDKYDILKISHNLKRPEVTKEIIKLYKLINKYIFFDLSKSNLKCRHSMIIEQPKYLTFERNNKIFEIDKHNQIKEKTL
jgi:hypothetical protein